LDYVIGRAALSMDEPRPETLLTPSESGSDSPSRQAQPPRRPAEGKFLLDSAEDCILSVQNMRGSTSSQNRPLPAPGLGSGPSRAAVPPSFNLGWWLWWRTVKAVGAEV